VEALRAKVRDTDEDALFQSIGMALTIWAKMEELLIAIMALLMRSDISRAGLILYSTVNFSVWLMLIHDLFEMDPLFACHIKQWNKIGERLRAIKDDRDRLAHHSVENVAETTSGIGSFGLRPSEYDVRRKSRRQKPMTLAEVREFTREVTAEARKLRALLDAMFDTYRASKERPSEPVPDH
jgi:hypothetical protein